MDQVSALLRAKQSTHPEARYWWVLAFICIPVFLGSLDLTVVSAFLPTLLSDLELELNSEGLADVSWVLTSYLLAYSVSLFAMGRVSDFIGRRSTLVICLGLYVLGSLFVIFFETPGSLLTDLYATLNVDFTPKQARVHAIILGRMIAAFGAGAITSIAIALVGDMFSPAKRAIPLGIVMAVDTVGWLVGAAWGGLVVQVLPWQAIFMINIPLVLVALVLMLIMLRDVPEHTTQGRFDLPGFLILGATLATLNIGLMNIDASGDGVDLSRTLPAVGLAAALLMVFIAVQARTQYPLIAPAIFRGQGVAGATLVNLLIGYCMFIPLVSIPLLINVQGLNQIGFAAVLTEIRNDALKDASFDTGVLMAAFTVPLAVASVIGGIIMDRLGAFWTSVLGLLMAVIGYGLLWLLLDLSLTNAEIGLMMAVTGIGIGLTFTPVISTMLHAISDQQRGMASAVVLGVRMVGMTISTSTLGVFGAQRINDLVESVESGRFVFDLVTPADYSSVFPITYIEAASQAIGEMSAIGMIGCLLALLLTPTLRRKDAV